MKPLTKEEIQIQTNRANELYRLVFVYQQIKLKKEKAARRRINRKHRRN